MTKAKQTSKTTETVQPVEVKAEKVEVKVEKTEKAPKEKKAAEKAVDPVEAAIQAAQTVKKEKKEKKAAEKKESDAPAEAAAEDNEVEKVDKKRVVTREELDAAYASLGEEIKAEVENIRKADAKTKNNGVRFLRSVLKKVNTLHTMTNRLLSKKGRRTAPSAATGNSGFMKQVSVSDAMHSFIGIKKGELVSRVQVTKEICNYVKAKGLQNQGDRRRFTPDSDLAKLLGTDQPITYYELQRQIQPHFVTAAK